MLIKHTIVLPFFIAMTLIGCGADDDDETTASDSETTELSAKLTGTWKSDCTLETRDRAHAAYITTMTIAGAELTNSGIEFTDTLCTTQLDTWGPDVMPYTLGESTSTTVGGDGVTYNAYPLNLTSSNGSFYTTVSLQTNDTKMLIALEDDVNDGSTAVKRAVEFTGAETLTKQ